MSNGPAASALAIDAMGSDLGPAEVVEGVSLALRSFPEIRNHIILVGDKTVLGPLVDKKKLEKYAKISIHHASEVIGMDEKPIQSLKNKKDASMLRAIDLVKDGVAQAVLSCGNTGSLMAAGTLRLRTLPGVERPALAIVAPTKDHNFVLLDAGANPESSPKNLVQNAILGYNYGKVVLHNERPRVGLLTIGTEEGKGTELINETHSLLKQMGSMIDYKGLIEGFQVFDNHVDVIVCDGFVGNIVLKACESLINNMKSYLKKRLQENPLRWMGALLAMGAFKDMKKQFSTERYAGSPLLGLKGIVVKAHGSSNRHAIMHAIHLTHKMLHREMNNRMLADIQTANDIMNPNNHSVDVR
ncbi:MAG: phosphate acyltransferase PlsX [Verrucomicrobia bacterium GWC2_42_7]|nr:MAG: phosphate acyltransferase PlsX [Verrucomicrobia bacterium GWC2_42_7]